MNNQDKTQKNPKLTQDEFFKQMRSLLERAPEDVTYFILALESPDSKSLLKEGILSLQGSPKYMNTLFTTSFNRSSQIKEIVFDSVEFYKFQKFSSR